jgi:hypothetical protein
METTDASGLRDFVSVLIGAALGIAFISVCGGSVGWVVRDAQKRWYSGGLVFFLVWFCAPSQRSSGYSSGRVPDSERPVSDYTNADDATHAASKLNMLGDRNDVISATFRRINPQWLLYPASR